VGVAERLRQLGRSMDEGDAKQKKNHLTGNHRCLKGGSCFIHSCFI
jgi:hypothetical protein